MLQPLVSVKVATYNHEPYIAQCLAGIMAQRTSFPFEVIVGEDCSTDSTRQIVQEYVDRYPEVIRLVTSETNVGPCKNITRIRQACRGQYEALCEGDDYWIHPDKLQRQVDYLEANPDTVLCFHDALCLTEDKSTPPIYYCPRGLSPTPSLAEVIQLPSFIPTASILARRSFLESLPEWRRELLCGDLVVRLYGAYNSRIRYLDEVMAVYRLHPGGLNARANRRRVVADAIIAYQKFDEATDYQHTALLRRRIHFEQQYMKWGSLYYLTHPWQALKRVRRRRQRAGF